MTDLEEEDWDAVVAAHVLPAGTEQNENTMFIHMTSKGASKIDVFEQPWCRLKWSKARANRYLAASPVGAFIIRRATTQGQYVLSVQAGPRVCHVLLRAIAKDGTILYNVYPTPQWFESLYDLVLFCSYQPFQFPDLEGSGEITLSLEASQRAERVYRDLLVKNAVARRMTMVARRASMIRKSRAPNNPSTLTDAIIEEAVEDKESEADSSRYSQGAILFRGFLTKLGRRRKNWKRRFFELSSAGCLTYYKVSGPRQEMGFLDLRKCLCVLPGGRCPITWYQNANPNLCFGIYVQNRQLYVYADTRPELQGWLQAIAEVVPDGIPVTSPTQIEIEAKMRAPLPPPTAGERKRLTVFRNGSLEQSQVVDVSTNWEELLAGITSKLGFPVTRLFGRNGGEFTSSRLLRDDDVVFGSAGEEFVSPRLAAEQRRRQKSKKRAEAARRSKQQRQGQQAQEGARVVQGVFGDTTGYDEPVTLRAQRESMRVSKHDTYMTPTQTSIDVAQAQETEAAAPVQDQQEHPAYLETLPSVRHSAGRGEQRDATFDSDSSDEDDPADDYDNLDGDRQLDEPMLEEARRAALAAEAQAQQQQQQAPTETSGRPKGERAPEDEEVAYMERPAPDLLVNEDTGYAEVRRPMPVPDFIRNDTYMEVGRVGSVRVPESQTDVPPPPYQINRTAREVEKDSSAENSAGEEPDSSDESNDAPQAPVTASEDNGYLSIGDLQALQQAQNNSQAGYEDPAYMTVVAPAGKAREATPSPPPPAQ